MYVHCMLQSISTCVCVCVCVCVGGGGGGGGIPGGGGVTPIYELYRYVPHFKVFKAVLILGRI